MVQKNFLDIFIHKLFSSSVKEPCFYQLQCKNKSLEEIFKILLNIYIKGISLLYFPGEDEIVIDNLTEPMITKLQLYMNSLGFNPIITSFTKKQLSELVDDFTKEVNNPDIYIYKKTSLNKEFAPEIKLAFRKTKTQKKIKKYATDLARAYSKYPKMRLILTLYNKKNTLKDFMLKSYAKNLHILQFDYAKPI